MISTKKKLNRVNIDSISPCQFNKSKNNLDIKKYLEPI
jgi:hypothetical protein